MNIMDIAINELAEQFPIGSPVKYIGETWWAKGVTGKVTNWYPGFDEDLKRCPEFDSVAVELDSRPENWPYTEDSFAPDVSDVELTK